MERQIPVKVGRCKCGSKPSADKKKYCTNRHCPCGKRGEPCIPPYCLCKECQNTANPEGYILPPEHDPKVVTLDDETEALVHPSLVLFEKAHVFGHLVGTSKKDDKQRKELNERAPEGPSHATCPQCGRLESTFLTWAAAHVVDLATAEYYLIKTCVSCNTKHAKEFSLRRKTLALLLCAHSPATCKCDSLYKSKITFFRE